MFKTFWKDYMEMVCKPQWAWLRKHWIGYLVILAVAFAIGFAVPNFNKIRYGVHQWICNAKESIRHKLTNEN